MSNVDDIKEYAERTGQFCFRCNKETPVLHSGREEVNYKTKTHWWVTYCPKCGTVTNVEKEPFNYSNFIPRIGKVRSVLFILLLSSPFLAIAWTLGWRETDHFGGPFVSLVILGLVYLVSKCKVHEVEYCKYKRWEQYPELVYRKRGGV